jgi:type II secretory pathway pseudopilin PulG
MNYELQRGISLLELMIYIAVFSIIAVVMIEIFFVSMRGRDLANARYEVAQNLRFATEQIRQTVFDASAISVSGACPSNILSATSSATSAASSFFISGNVFNFSNASGTFAITTDKVIATTTSPGDCLFTIVNNPAPAKSTLQVKIKMVYNSQGRSDLDISDSRQITVSLR